MMNFIKRYWKWIAFGLVAIGLLVLWLLVASNKNLRQRVEVLLLEKFVRNKVQGLQDEAAAANALAASNEKGAQEAAKRAKELEAAISEQKQSLQSGLESRGLNADEIANRFRNLNI